MVQQCCCAWRHECDSCFGAGWGWMLDMDRDMIGRLSLSQRYRGVKASQGLGSQASYLNVIAAVCCVHTVAYDTSGSTVVVTVPVLAMSKPS